MQAKLFRVFTNLHGRYGDKASVVIDEEKKIPDEHRREITRELGTGETIFINDFQNASVSVMHPQGEISFAGVGILATAWYLSALQNKPIKKFIGRDGEITVWQDDQLTWVRTDIKTLPHWHFQQRETATEIE
jgi:predicted PhzF superfamily epimerase YddE/YHI9